MLRDNIVKTRLSSASPIPLHVISLFSYNNDTQTFLRSIAQNADGRFVLKFQKFSLYSKYIFFLLVIFVIKSKMNYPI
jgi:hypothetical protein